MMKTDIENCQDCVYFRGSLALGVVSCINDDAKRIEDILWKYGLYGYIYTCPCYDKKVKK